MSAHDGESARQSTSLESHFHAGGGSLAQREDGESRQQGQLVRSSDGDLSLHLDASHLGFDDRLGSLGSGLQKHHILYAHCPDQAIQPT